MSTIVTANVKRPSGSPDNISTEYIVEGTDKAWVVGTGSAVILESFNMSGGTDHGTGDFSYTLTNAFTDLNYSQRGCCNYTAGSQYTRNGDRDTASLFAQEVFNATGTAADLGHNGSALGELA